MTSMLWGVSIHLVRMALCDPPWAPSLPTVCR